MKQPLLLHQRGNGEGEQNRKHRLSLNKMKFSVVERGEGVERGGEGVWGRGEGNLKGMRTDSKIVEALMELEELSAPSHTFAIFMAKLLT